MVLGIRSMLLVSISNDHLTASFCCRCSNEISRRTLSSSRWCCAEDAGRFRQIMRVRQRRVCTRLCTPREFAVPNLLTRFKSFALSWHA